MNEEGTEGTRENELASFIDFEVFEVTVSSFMGTENLGILQLAF
eukprot:CAMPEP_0113268330 /NCGR_PEP_ID=MMETSP0008_2-20120614/21113_1 /TAXON_ID=97485 /ORGANISM="Prymnesium parvum" /LENGTH=43 /DNA_ID=CAMNT_0000117479 /DNA_START=224 /DNA_END=355 /DNA_ORIENTATION=- /assembly_acc=CAM_ASM_000153